MRFFAYKGKRMTRVEDQLKSAHSTTSPMTLTSLYYLFCNIIFKWKWTDWLAPQESTQLKTCRWPCPKWHWISL